MSVRLIGDCIVVLGTGRIASSIAKALDSMTTTVITVTHNETPSEYADLNYLDNYGFAIVIEDEWTRVSNPWVERLRSQGTPFLVVSGRMNRVFVGPLERPDIIGCSNCVNIRWMNSHRLSPLMSSLGQVFEQSGLMHLPLTVKDADINLVAEFVASEVSNMLNGYSPVLQGKVGVIRTGANQVALKTLIPSDDCPRCEAMVPPYGDVSSVPCRSHRISVPNALRVKDFEPDVLHDTFVDSDIGLISRVDVKQLAGGNVGVHAHLQLSHQKSALGSSVNLTQEDAERTAILEVLERACGRYPSQISRRMVGPYAELSETALHPKVFGLHDEAMYSKENSRYQSFQPDMSYHWVEGFSCRNQVNVWVPEQLAYHGVSRQGEAKFLQQTSNGCAIGGSFDEAVLYGLLEVLERDAFLNTWYAKLPVPEISLEVAINDDDLPWIQNLQEHGYDIQLFDISHDFMIPSVLAVAVNRYNEFPNVICGTAAHLLPNIAITKAVRELATQVLNMWSTSVETIASAREKLSDPVKVQTISDHRVVGALPEARSHWSFLLDRPRCTRKQMDTFSQVSEKYNLSSNDMGIILNRVLEDMFSHGFDVIVVPQTRVEIACAGLHAARVLVPGMLPMTFGHEYRRVQGLERVLQLPYMLGYSDRPLTIDELNNDPHPFA